MKKFIKENWFKLTIIFIVISVTTGLFYWFEWRPTKIKKSCIWMQRNEPWNKDQHGKWYRASSFEYERCLQDHGL